jgi:hypothetical protein
LAFALACVAALVRAGALLAPHAVEHVYARRLFAWLVAALTALSSRVPFSLAELLVLLLAPLVALRGLRRLARFHRAPARPARPARLHPYPYLLPALPAAYLAFLLVWGLNYERWPAARLFQIDAAGGSTRELLALGRELADTAGRERRHLRLDASGVVDLGAPRDVLARAPLGYARLALSHPWLPRLTARPKALWSSVLFSRLGITGIYMPFTGEAHVNVDAPAFLWPATACHELAHQHGLAREDEASFVGYLAGRGHPDADFRYAASFDALGDVLAALNGAAPESARELATTLDAGVGHDLRVLYAWARRHAGPARELARSVNDAYLRTQGQADGVRSYGRVVDLLLADRRARRAAAAPEAAAVTTVRPDRPTAPAAR